MTSLVDEGNAVHIVYLDFSKAFDKVPHDILVRKLVKTGLDKVTIHGSVIGWLIEPKGCSSTVHLHLGGR